MFSFSSFASFFLASGHVNSERKFQEVIWVHRMKYIRSETTLQIIFLVHLILQSSAKNIIHTELQLSWKILNQKSDWDKVVTLKLNPSSVHYINFKTRSYFQLHQNVWHWGFTSATFNSNHKSSFIGPISGHMYCFIKSLPRAREGGTAIDFHFARFITKDLRVQKSPKDR